MSIELLLSKARKDVSHLAWDIAYDSYLTSITAKTPSAQYHIPAEIFIHVGTDWGFYRTLPTRMTSPMLITLDHYIAYQNRGWLRRLLDWSFG